MVEFITLIASFKLFFMLIVDNSEWKYILAEYQSSSDFGNLTSSLRKGNSSCLLFVVTKQFSVASCLILSITKLLLLKDVIALHDLWCTLRPQSPLDFLPQLHLRQSLFKVLLWSRLTVSKLLETLSLPWLPLFLRCFNFSLDLQLWQFKSSKFICKHYK